MTLVAQQAPDFSASAVLPNGKIVDRFRFHKFIKNQIAVLFFWPMDFTFVCPSEVIAFDKRCPEFDKRKAKVVGVSADSVFVHAVWRSTSVEQGGIGNVRYPMVADVTKSIMQAYRIQHPTHGVALRGSFLIDRDNVVRHQVVNDFPFGRNIDDMLRTIDALKFHEQHGEVCPAQWTPRRPGIVPSFEGVKAFLSRNVDAL